MPDIIFASIITAFFTAAATSGLTYFGYWRQKEAELRKELESRLNEQKWEAYKNFMIMQSRMVNSMKSDSAETRVALLLVASGGVIQAFNDSVSARLERDEEKRKMSDARLLAEMRKDLGYKSYVNPDDLLKMFEWTREV